MKNTFNPNSERISRKAETLHWTAENTEAVHSFLAKNSLVSELYKDTRYMSVRLDNTIYHTLRHGDWIVKGEDLKIRFYDADKYALMYRPIDDELERLRAFAREILNLECPKFQRYQKDGIAAKHGINAILTKE